MWFFLALSFALWTSIAVSISKRILKNVSPQLMAATGIFSLPFYLIILLVTGGLPRVDLVFWFGVIISTLLGGVVAGILYFTAIKHAPISLLSPMSSFTPVFTTIFATFTLREIPSLVNLAGIIIIVIGAYLLHISDIKTSLLGPFRELISNRYIQFFLLAHLMVAITPIFEKTAIFHTSPNSPILVAATGSVLTSFFLTPVVLKTVQNPLEELKRNIHWFLLLAPFSALAVWAAFTAYSLANLGYVTAIFKLSILFTILWGWLIFKEERIKERLLGGGVILVGTLLLVL